MLLSDMTAKGNLHLHPAAEGGSHGEMQALLPLVFGGSTETQRTFQTKGHIWLSPLPGLLGALQGNLVLPITKTRGMTRGHPRLSSHSGPLRGWGGGAQRGAEPI